MLTSYFVFLRVNPVLMHVWQVGGVYSGGRCWSWIDGVVVVLLHRPPILHPWFVFIYTLNVDHSEHDADLEVLNCACWVPVFYPAKRYLVESKVTQVCIV